MTTKGGIAAQPPAWMDREFIDMRFAALEPREALAAITARPADAPFAYVITPNVDHLVRLEHSPALRKLYDGAWLRLCDSRILSRLARLYGIDLPVVTGSDLTVTLLRDGVARDDRVCVIGGDAHLVKALQAFSPGVTFVQHIPPMGLARNEAALDAAARFAVEARGRFAMLAVGSPQQEMLAYRIAQRGDAVGLGLCIGASLDFITGTATRAPRWIQHAGLEWAHRLLSEPKRMWKRYLVEGPHIFLMARRWDARRRRP